MENIGSLSQMSVAEIESEIMRGSKFIKYEFCVSILIFSFKRFSGVYLVRQGESTALMTLGFCLISLLFGWWGIPWGPIWTAESLARNLGGGKDLTPSLRASMTSNQPSRYQAPQQPGRPLI